MRPILPLLSVLAACLLTEVASAETAQVSGSVNTTEGVSGFLDKKRRAPSLSVGVSRGTADAVKLLADAYVANEEYTEYPVKFEFFVNRALVATQIRSKELTGPVGIDVDAKRYPFPFNYTVIATVLAPNRTFTTVLNGAVFSSDLTGGGSISSCQLALSDTVTIQSEENARTYTADSVAISQTSNSTIQVDFESSKLSDGTNGENVVVKATISVDGENASGQVSVTEGDKATTTTATTGTATSVEGNITGFTVSSTDKKTVLTCS